MATDPLNILDTLFINKMDRVYSDFKARPWHVS